MILKSRTQFQTPRSEQLSVVCSYLQRQRKERAKLLNFAKVTMANLCIRQSFPRQNPKPIDSPKFYLAKVLRYTV